MQDNAFLPYNPQGIFEGVRKYDEKLPDDAYKHLIAFYNQFVLNRQSIPRKYTAIPSGCTDLKFHCHPRRPAVFICGTKKRNELTNLPCDNYDLFGIRFWPGQFYRFFPFHSEAFTNIEVDLHSISDLKIHRTTNQILEAPSFIDRILIWENFLDDWKKLTEIPTWIDAIINMILQSKGKIEIAQLSEKIGYSDRHIRREFNRVVGVSQKCFIRIITLQNALKEMQNNSTKPLADIALDYGYYDQAHFTHEFKEFYGKPPSVILPHPKIRFDPIIIGKS